MVLHGEESPTSTWRFGMELLSHVHTLRVFLLPSSSQVQPTRDCTHLEATLLPAPPSLSCSWKAANKAASHSLRLPLPVLLFDYSASPHISVLTDCIQLSLYLLPLPPLHLYALSSLSLDCVGPADISGVVRGVNHAKFDRLDGRTGAQCDNADIAHQLYEKDATMESRIFQNCAVNDVCFDECIDQIHDSCHTTMLPTDAGIHGGVSCEVEGICKAQQAEHCADGEHYGCSSHLNVKKGIQYDHTHQSLRYVQCNDGMSTVDTCQDSCNSCLHDIHPRGNGCNHEQSTVGPLCIQCPKEKSKANKRLTHCNSTVKASDDLMLCQHLDIANNGSSPHGQYGGLARCSKDQGSEDHPLQGESATFVCKNCLGKVSKKPVRTVVQLPCFDWREVAENWFGACCCSFGSTAEVLSVSFERSLQLWPGKCLIGHLTFYVDFTDVEVKAESGLLSTETSMQHLTTPSFLAFGNGFMVWENQQSKAVKWLPVHCASCASLIGAYPRTSTLFPSSTEGLHLFRSQVYSCNADGTFHDEYRFKTFKDLLVKELRLRTEENTTYRFLIRSLNSELPLLQLVVLNYDTLICTGKVNTDVIDRSQCGDEMINEAGLQQSVKVLFSDCTRFVGDNVRSAELWVKEHDAEIVFMLEEFVDKLRDELLANSMFCPADCGLFQSFMGSFLFMIPA